MLVYATIRATCRAFPPFSRLFQVYATFSINTFSATIYSTTVLCFECICAFFSIFLLPFVDILCS